MPRRKATDSARGKLRIGDDWNAITIIALSQSNPLKAVAEFVENSIDAQAKHIRIVRGREHGVHYLRVSDDGQGLPRNEEGIPDFRYVATHVCDSIKRRLKEQGVAGVQGEFGIGLLSFWTVGEELTLTSAGADGRTYQMTLRKGDPGYTVTEKRVLLATAGADLRVKPLLPGLRQLSGEKIQWYLASELRDRIRQSGVRIAVIDHQARKELTVEPRRFTGRLLHELPVPRTPLGEVYLELYLSDADPAHAPGLYRSGTRVLERIDALDAFQGGAWSSGCLQGIVDAPFLHLTPGTRSGIILDDRFSAFCDSMRAVQEALDGIIEEQRRAEEQRASRQVLHTIRRAIREALLALPAEEYDWFEIHKRAAGFRPGMEPEEPTHESATGTPAEVAPSSPRSEQKQFFEFAGPLFNAVISPATCVMQVGGTRAFRAIPRDRSRRLVENDLTYEWTCAEGGGRLENAGGEIATFHAPSEPGLTRLRVSVRQTAVVCEAEALVTVTDSLVEERRPHDESHQGLPGYTYHRAPGELWRSRYDAAQNLIVINNGHRDFVYAAGNKALKLRYIARLFAKELVRKNFPGASADQLLERMIELTLRMEENLK